ncbi:hypothetical protein Nmel_011481, partial [Mimus melanotis]
FPVLWHYWCFTASRASSLCVYVTSLTIAHGLTPVLPSKLSLQRQGKIRRQIIPDLNNHPLLKKVCECCHPCSHQQICCN